MENFRGKNILITGTSRGIGATLVEHFLKQEADVYAISRSHTNIENCNLRKWGGGVEQVEDIKEWLRKENAKIDILINNAGENCYNSLREITREQIEAVFETNVVSTFLLTRMIVNEMIKEERKGVIVNTLSFAANIPSVGSAFYAASKAALTSLTKTMAAEWAPYGIRVNGYSPGVIETDMTKPAIEKNKEKMLDAISLRKIGNTKDIIGAVSFLASDESKYITGINLDVSGGKFIVQNSDIAWKNRL